MKWFGLVLGMVIHQLLPEPLKSQLETFWWTVVIGMVIASLVWVIWLIVKEAIKETNWREDWLMLVLSVVILTGIFTWPLETFVVFVLLSIVCWLIVGVRSINDIRKHGYKFWRYKSELKKSHPDDKFSDEDVLKIMCIHDSQRR